MKSRKILLFGFGTFTGFICIVFLILVGFISYKIMNSIIYKFDESHIPKSIALQFNLDFEDPKQLGIFKTQGSSAEISNDFSIKGKHSLLVEFPAGVQYPGIYLELAGKKNCLNWKNKGDFTLDTFNWTDVATTLTIQLRSGEKYPKRELKKEFSLPSKQLTHIVITETELDNALDLTLVSHLTLFIANPDTTLKVYFDDIKVAKN